MIRNLLIGFYLVGMGAFFCAPVAYAQSSTQSGVIQNVEIQGTQRIESETIRSYMRLKEGDLMDPVLVDASLKALFATGLFADVNIRRQGGTIVISVVENPIVNNLAFEGNLKLKNNMLETEVQLKPRTVYTRTKVQADVRRVLELYRRAGRFGVTVDPKVITRDQNRIDLVFEINEGPPTYVRRINVIGNREFSDSDLRDVVLTKEDRWYRVLSGGSTYDPDRLTYDRELLRRFYLSEGFADFRVASAVAELTPDREGFYVTVTVEEGARYKFGDLTVDASLAQLSNEELTGLIEVEKGDWYDSNVIETIVQAITDRVGQLGYAFVEVRPRVKRNRDAGTIDIVFDVQEGPRVFVERIDITGNVRTLDEVVRREFRLVEGDAFNAAKLRLSKKRIKNLGFFEKVVMTNIPSEVAQDRTIIKVNVQEKSTGELSFGIGWSSSNGPMFDIGVRERNLLGRGQDLNAKVQISALSAKGNISFTEPYFMDRQLAAGFDVFSMTQDKQTESSYNSASSGGSLRLGFSYTENLFHSLRYSGRTSSVKSVAANASKYIVAEQGSTTLSSVSHSLTYDVRDNRFEPTKGYRLNLSNELAGLGGTEKFLRTDVDGSKHFSIAKDWILGVKARTGYIVGLGQDVSLSQRYVLGGDSLRGFANSGVGPRDITTGDALGGNWVATGSAQLDFPLGLPNELGIKGRLFTDMGTIGSADGVLAADVNDKQSIRLSLGTGIAWRSPMGPLSLDFGFPIIRESFDKTEVFRVNFGTRF